MPSLKVGKGRLPAALLALAIFILYSCYSFFQYRHYITPSWDLGIFTQLAKAYSQGQLPPIVTIKGEGFNLWGDHFHPILILLGPLYWLFPSPATLLYLQNALLALSVYFFHRFGQAILPGLANLGLTVAFALSFGMQNAVAVQFHEVAFALPFLLLSLGNLVLARWQQSEEALKRACLWSLPLVFVKEDLGFTVAIVGLLVVAFSGYCHELGALLFPLAETKPGPVKERMRLLLRSWRARPLLMLASFTTLWGAGWSVLAMRVVLPFFNTAGVFDYADRVDLAGALADPLQTAALFFYPWEKSASLGLLLLTGVLVWVVSPLALLALPTISWRFLSSNSGYWESSWHYSLVLMPVVFLALLDLLARARAAALRRPAGRGQSAAAGYLMRVKNRYQQQGHWALPALALLVTVCLLPSQPLWQLTDQNFVSWQDSASDRNKRQVLKLIPSGSTVASDLSLITYLVPEHQVYWIAHSGLPAPDYVIIDQASPTWGSSPPGDPVAYVQQRYQKTYRLAHHLGSIYVIEASS